MYNFKQLNCTGDRIDYTDDGRYSGQNKRQLEAPGGNVEIVGSDDEAKGGFKHGGKVGRMWGGKQEGACNKEVACVKSPVHNHYVCMYVCMYVCVYLSVRMLQVHRNVHVRRFICLYDNWNIVVRMWFCILCRLLSLTFVLSHVLSHVLGITRQRGAWC